MSKRLRQQYAIAPKMARTQYQTFASSIKGNDITTQDRNVSNQKTFGPAGSRRRGLIKRRWPVYKRLARLEAGFVKPEKHYKLTQTATLGATSAAPALVLLNGLSRGDTVQDRTGDCVNLGKGHVSGFLHTAGTGVINAFDARLLVILDSQPNTAALTAAILFGSATPTPQQMYNFNNYDFFKRFTVLHDEKISLNDNMTYDGNSFQPTQNSRPIDFGWDCKQFKADYAGGNAGTIADIRSGSIYMVLITNNSTGLNLNYDAVQYFTDN